MADALSMFKIEYDCCLHRHLDNSLLDRNLQREKVDTDVLLTSSNLDQFDTLNAPTSPNQPTLKHDLQNATNDLE